MGYLSDSSRDIITMVGAIGTIATLIGLGVAIWQLKKTRDAAVAAREAAEDTNTANQKEFIRYTIANTQRFIAEARIHATNRNWTLAAYRLGDIANEIVQLAHVVAEDKTSWAELADESRNWQQTLENLNTQGNAKFAARKWEKFHIKLAKLVGSYYGPFLMKEQNEHSN